MITALLKYWQVGAGAVLGALLAAGPVYFYGASHGRQQAVVAQLQSDIQAERDRNKSDAKLQSLSDYDLCVQSLHSRRMRIDACEQLRGLSESEP